MIDLYYWTTPNGHKVTMFLEETGLPYRIVPVNIGTGAQFEPAFLAISPNNRIPAIVDHPPGEAGRRGFSNAALSWLISRRKAAGCCPRTCAVRWRCCNGSSGRWQAWARWRD